MTGLDCLYDELVKRGFARSAVTKSRTIPAVLDIVANSGGEFTNLFEARQQYEKTVIETKRREMQIKNIIEKNEESMRIFENEVKTYFDKFEAALNACETPEGRDAMRAAQVFINSVDIDTKYDNTSYIIGLASILSGGKFGPIDELKKVNRQLFEKVRI